MKTEHDTEMAEVSGTHDDLIPVIQTRPADKAKVEEFWRMPWSQMEVALGLESLMKLRSLDVPNFERADQFLKDCGFDMSRSAHKKSVEQFIGEALFFIRHVLLTPEERERLVVPRDLLNLEDPRKLLLAASERVPRKRYRRLWACAILKVANAIANLEYSGRIKHLEAAREQIFGRIKKLLHVENGQLRFVTGKGHANLIQVDWKEAKTRFSILLKLIHKPDSVVDEVFDFLGVRFVVSREAEIPVLLKLLMESDIVVPYQVLSIRTRNSLLNLQKGRKLLEFLEGLLSTDTITPEEFTEMCERLDWSFAPGEMATSRRSNLFSSSMYRSLQLTVQHLVRTPNPAYLVVDSLNRQVRRFRGIDYEDHLVASLVPQELALYFPIEIQIMDMDSYDLSRFGPASHEQYKGLQLKTVREKILGSLLSLTPEKMSAQEL